MLITQDQIAGNELSRTGDLAPANVRLAQRGVRIERRSILRAARAGEVELEDRFSGERRTVACAALVDCGFRLPTDPLPAPSLQAGDCVAPRTIHEAILEGRRAAMAIDHVAVRTASTASAASGGGSPPGTRNIPPAAACRGDRRDVRRGSDVLPAGRWTGQVASRSTNACTAHPWSVFETGQRRSPRRGAVSPEEIAPRQRGASVPYLLTSTASMRGSVRCRSPGPAFPSSSS